MMLSFMLTDTEKTPFVSASIVCRPCGKQTECGICGPPCKNKYKVYKIRTKEKKE